MSHLSCISKIYVIHIQCKKPLISINNLPFKSLLHSILYQNSIPVVEDFKGVLGATKDEQECLTLFRCKPLKYLEYELNLLYLQH